MQRKIVLTERMKAWIEAMGCHLCVATLDGDPFVTVARFAKVVDDDEVAFALSKDEFGVIEPAFMENPWVAFGVSRQGGVRAPYQFKGIGRIAKEGEAFERIAKEATEVDTHVVLYVKIKEIYCTKPGAEAGTRLDVMSPEELQEWEKCRWTDIPRR